MVMASEELSTTARRTEGTATIIVADPNVEELPPIAGKGHSEILIPLIADEPDTETSDDEGDSDEPEIEGFLRIFRPTKLTPELMEQLLELFKKQTSFHHGIDPGYYAPWSDDLRDSTVDEITNKVTKGCLFAAQRIDDVSTKEEAIEKATTEEMELVGYVTFEKEEVDYYDTQFDEFVEVKELFVDRRARRRGLARRLVDLVVAHSRHRWPSVSNVVVQCSSRNDGALPAYESLGFQDRQRRLFRKIKK